MQLVVAGIAEQAIVAAAAAVGAHRVAEQPVVALAAEQAVVAAGGRGRSELGHRHGIADQQIVAIAADQGVGAAAAVRLAAEPEAREVERIADDGVVAVAAIEVVVAAEAKLAMPASGMTLPGGTVKKPI